MGQPKIVDVACVNETEMMNFQRAVFNGIPRTQYESYTYRPDTDPTRIWGVPSRGKWQKPEPGDYVFFYTRYREYRYVATLVDKEVNSRLAEEIFESEDDTYESIFFDEGRAADIRDGLREFQRD